MIIKEEKNEKASFINFKQYGSFLYDGDSICNTDSGFRYRI